MRNSQEKLEKFKQAARELSTHANLGHVALRIAQDPLQFLMDYTQFSKKAPYAVATITGALGHLEPFGQATHDMLGFVHAAIGVEEMGMESRNFRDSHPVLSRMMAEEAAKFAGRPIPIPTPTAQKCAEDFYDLYAGTGNNLADPYQAAIVLGAHAGSEFVAINEFAVILNVLQTQQPDLYRYLEQTNLTAFPEVPAITWLACHGGEDGVETLHAEYALHAAAEVITTPQLRKAWQSGFKEIVAILNDFFLILPEANLTATLGAISAGSNIITSLTP